MDSDSGTSGDTAGTVDDLRALVRSTTARAEAAAGAVQQCEQAATSAALEARRTHIPHAGAWRALLTGRYRSARTAADERAAAAAEALRAATDRRQRADRDRQLAQDRLVFAQRRAAEDHQRAVDAAIAQVLQGGGDGASQLSSHLAECESADAQLAEIAEAASAVLTARQAADDAARELDRAHSWGTYDTFFGGGMISSSIKHDRIDSADSAMGRVQAALHRARKELADVAIEVAAPDLSGVGSGRTLDIWFDNIFSDLGTQSRIEDGRRAVERLRTELAGVTQRLRQAHDEWVQRRTEALAARDALIAPVLPDRGNSSRL